MSKQQGFCMVGGTGLTSYANNSIVQKSIIGKIKPLLDESIRAVYDGSFEYLSIADLGCSSSPNSLVVLKSIIKVVISMAQSSGSDSIIPELNVFLNDLSQNDFNSIFKTLPDFHKEIIDQEHGIGIKCYIYGTPGSFYGRLFPRNFMHFMYSFSCLHWLSQVPKGLTRMNERETMNNKGCIYGRKGSPREVLKAYREQFSEDFTMFLRHRSEEIIHGGRIVLSFISTKDDEACPVMELTSIALHILASQGKIEKEKLDMFNLNYYRPTIDQVKQLIESEGSFILDNLDTFVLSWIEIIRAEQVKNEAHRDVDYHSDIDIAKSITKSFRAIMESVLASEFGDEMMDEVFHLVEEMVINAIATGQEILHTNLSVSLTRK